MYYLKYLFVKQFTQFAMNESSKIEIFRDRVNSESRHFRFSNRKKCSRKVKLIELGKMFMLVTYQYWAFYCVLHFIL